MLRKHRGAGELAVEPAADEKQPGKQGDEGFLLMQRVMKVLPQVIAQGVENKLDRENLLDHLREVLADYPRLKGTEYAVTINNYLVRACWSELTMKLGAADLAALWK